MKTRHIKRANEAMKSFHGGAAMFLRNIEDTIKELQSTSDAIQAELPHLYDLKKFVEETARQEPSLPSTEDEIEDELEGELKKGLTDPIS